jgi:hypothetical protein
VFLFGPVTKGIGAISSVANSDNCKILPDMPILLQGAETYARARGVIVGFGANSNRTAAMGSIGEIGLMRRKS